MKITKIKTKVGNFGSPVSAELSAIADRMRSTDIKTAADRIAAITLHSRLMMEKGAPRYYIEDIDRLPYLIFSSTFGKDGLSKPTRFTSLLLLNIPCPQGIRQIAEIKNRVRQIPYTMLAFSGVSGVTLKVLVRCRYDKSEVLDTEDYLAFLKDAHESAARLYTTLAQCDLYVKELQLTNGCRMSYDPQLYYNPQAEILPVIREQQEDPLREYEGTKADEDGTVNWYPDFEERQRIELEFQVCLSKAIDDSGDNMEKCLQTLADYCHKACLSEEGCIVRTSWNARFKDLGEDVIRKTFRNS